MKNVLLLFVIFTAFSAFAADEVISVNKPIEAISVWGDGFEANKANDGDETTRWASKGHADEAKWIYIDLEETYSISAVTIIWEAAYGQDFTIDVSDDASNWTVAKTVVGNESDGKQELTGIEAEGRYVRINITAGNPAHAHASIFEFSVFGQIKTGIEAVENNRLKIFPNPSSNVINVVSSDNAKANLSIYDITGRNVLNRSFVGTEVINAKEIGLLGVYFMTVEKGNEVHTEKIVIR